MNCPPSLSLSQSLTKVSSSSGALLHPSTCCILGLGLMSLSPRKFPFPTPIPDRGDPFDRPQLPRHVMERRTNGSATVVSVCVRVCVCLPLLWSECNRYRVHLYAAWRMRRPKRLLFLHLTQMMVDSSQEECTKPLTKQNPEPKKIKEKNQSPNIENPRIHIQTSMPNRWGFNSKQKQKPKLKLKLSFLTATGKGKGRRWRQQQVAKYTARNYQWNIEMKISYEFFMS